MIISFNLPNEGSWRGVLHVFVAHVTHLASEQVEDLNGTILLGGSNILVIVVKADAVSSHID